MDLNKIDEEFDKIHKDGDCCGCYEGDIGDYYPKKHNELKNFLHSKLTEAFEKGKGDTQIEIKVKDLKDIIIDAIEIRNETLEEVEKKIEQELSQDLVIEKASEYNEGYEDGLFYLLETIKEMKK